MLSHLGDWSKPEKEITPLGEYIYRVYIHVY